MPEIDVTHFFTGERTLCGARIALRLSVIASRTTCPACRAMLEEQEQFEAEASAHPIRLLTTRGR